MCVQREVGPLGSRLASIESAQAFEALLQLPGPGEDASERVLVEAAHAAFVTAGGVETMLRVAGNNGPPASAGAAAACVMSAFRSHGAAAHGAFAAAHGPAAMVRVMRNPYVSLPHRAAAAGVLWHYIVPDQPGTGRGKGASSKKAAAGGSAADVDQVSAAHRHFWKKNKWNKISPLNALQAGWLCACVPAWPLCGWLASKRHLGRVVTGGRAHAGVGTRAPAARGAR